MGEIKINDIVYGTDNASSIIYKNTTVEEKLDTIPVFDPSDNTYIEANQYDYLTYGHIVDTLTSNDSNKILSAKQGKVLNDKIRVLEEEPQSVVIKMTQADYDALPDSKYSDGILYAIIDDNGDAEGGMVAKPVELTKAQYEALGDSVLNDNILYAITDGDGLTAKGIEYDGSVSGLGNNIQDAIDNLKKFFEPVELWKNPSPSSGFAAQSLTINWSKYKRILIEVGYTTTIGAGGGATTFEFLTDSVNRIITAHYITPSNTITARDIYFENNTIRFGANSLGGITNSMASNNNYCIPLRIFGMNYL